MWLLSECLAINIFRKSDQKSIETSQNSDQKSIETSQNSDQKLTKTSQNSDQKSIETSQNSDQKRIFYAEMLTCLRPSSRSRSIYHSWCCTDYIIAQYGYYALKPCKIKLIYFLFCLNLFEKGYHVDGIVNNSPLCLDILLTEHIRIHFSNVYISVFLHFSKSIMV